VLVKVKHVSDDLGDPNYTTDGKVNVFDRLITNTVQVIRNIVSPLKYVF